MSRFDAEVEIIGVNPFVHLPEPVLREVFAQAGKDKGPIPIRGALNGAPYVQTLVKYAGAWRLYLNGPMLKAAEASVGDSVTVEVEVDPTPPTYEMHPKLATALASDPKAKAAFDALTPGRQKEILRYLASLKSETTVDRNVPKLVLHLLGKETDSLHALMRR